MGKVKEYLEQKPTESQMIRGIPEEAIRHLQFLARGYQDVTKALTPVRTGISSTNPYLFVGLSDTERERVMMKEDIIRELERVKGQLDRRMKTHLKHWPLWSRWLEKVPGIGGAIGSRLILLYYYKFVPVCPQCGGDIVKKEIPNGRGGERMGFYCEACDKVLKGEGNIQHRIEVRDFPNISSLWSFFGAKTVEVDGKFIVPMRKKGEKCSWSPEAKNVRYLIGDQMQRQQSDNPYKMFYNARKAQRLRDSMDVPPMRRLARVLLETEKLFLSHMWVVAREIDGLSITEPYVAKHMGHDVIPPYFWPERKSEEVD